MSNNFTDAVEQYALTSGVAENKFNEMARSLGVIVSQVAIVSSYNSSTNQARVYFPTDLTTESNLYDNKTNTTLTVGQKVYIFHKYGDVGQGWIMA